MFCSELIAHVNVSNPQQIADQFNSYFSSVADLYLNKIPSTKTTHNDFPSKVVSSSFEFKAVDHNVIQKVINNLESKVSCDINGFSSKLLKECSEFIIKPLTHLVNLSLSQEIFTLNTKPFILILFRRKSKMQQNTQKWEPQLPINHEVVL